MKDSIPNTPIIFYARTSILHIKMTALFTYDSVSMYYAKVQSVLSVHYVKNVINVCTHTHTHTHTFCSLYMMIKQLPIIVPQIMIITIN